MFTLNESYSPTSDTFSPTFDTERGRRRLLEFMVLIEVGNRRTEKKIREREKEDYTLRNYNMT